MQGTQTEVRSGDRQEPEQNRSEPGAVLEVWHGSSLSPGLDKKQIPPKSSVRL